MENNFKKESNIIEKFKVTLFDIMLCIIWKYHLKWFDTNQKYLLYLNADLITLLILLWGK